VLVSAQKTRLAMTYLELLVAGAKRRRLGKIGAL